MPLGIYVHVPFCSQRCSYCDFYFVTTSRATGPFVAALAVEAEAYAARVTEPVGTIYVGGGTPSLLPLGDVATLLGALHQHYETAAVEEITFEANPEDLAGPDGLDYLRGLKALGVTRLSVGVQSFYDEDLRRMNRAHSGAQAEEAIAHIEKAGFASYSADLIFGLPEQPFELWGANLEKAARLGVPHLSTYSLTVEERTPLHKLVATGKVAVPGDDALRERFLFTMDYLVARGYDHYEVCTFSQPGHRSRHNQGYWRHEPYLGLGPSAHGMLWKTRSLAERVQNVRSLNKWSALLQQGEWPVEAREPVTLDQLADEHVLLRLRLMDDGLDLDHLLVRYGFDLRTEKAAELRALQSGGLVRQDGATLRLTREGACVADAVALKLIG